MRASIDLPIVLQYADEYYDEEWPMKATTQYVMKLREDLRSFVLNNIDEDEKIEKAFVDYYEELKSIYSIELQMLNIAKIFKDRHIKIGVSSLYHYLNRTRKLWNLPKVDIYSNFLPFSTIDFTHDNFFNSWWNLVFVELEEDPREVYKDELVFRSIDGSTEKNVPKLLEAHQGTILKGLSIIRRESEVYSGSLEEGGVILVYVWVKDNSDDKVPTKTIYFFSVDYEDNSIVSVYPVIVNIN